jgi:hypothetical protein
MEEGEGNANDLTPEQSMAMDYMGDLSNQVTREGNAGKWKENVFKNRPFFRRENPDLLGATVFIVGAGPSLDINVAELKKISERGVIVCVDAALRFLLRSGVRPDYCMMIDGSEKMKAMIEGCDTEGITLVCTPAACPEVIAAWKGPLFFVITPFKGGDRKYDIHNLTRIVTAKKEIKAGEEVVAGDHYQVDFEGVNAVVMCGGNVSTSAHHFAVQFLKSQKVVFVGMDYSWKFESHHYAGHEHEQNAKDRTGIEGASATGSHIDVNGESVNTNLSLLAFKRWHEMMARQMKGSVVNATEGGILGVTQKGEHVDFMEFMTLAEAVAKYAPIRCRT